MIHLTNALRDKYIPYQGNKNRIPVSSAWAIVNGYKTPETFLVPEIPSPEAAIKMLRGEVMGSMCEELLRVMGYETQIKVEYPVGDWVLVGKIDAMNPDDVLEIKTPSDDRVEAKAWEAYQLRLYLTMFQREQGYVVRPIITDDEIRLHRMRKSTRNDEWFAEQIKKLDEFQKLL